MGYWWGIHKHSQDTWLMCTMVYDDIKPVLDLVNLEVDDTGEIVRTIIKIKASDSYELYIAFF